MSYGTCHRAEKEIICVDCGAKESYDRTEIGYFAAPEYRHRYLCRKCKAVRDSRKPEGSENDG